MRINLTTAGIALLFAVQYLYYEISPVWTIYSFGADLLKVALMFAFVEYGLHYVYAFIAQFRDIVLPERRRGEEVRRRFTILTSPPNSPLRNEF